MGKATNEMKQARLPLYASVRQIHALMVSYHAVRKNCPRAPACACFALFCQIAIATKRTALAKQRCSLLRPSRDAREPGKAMFIWQALVTFSQCYAAEQNPAADWKRKTSALVTSESAVFLPSPRSISLAHHEVAFQSSVREPK